MTEFEIKLEIPPARLASVRHAVERLRGSTQRLQATYYDTPGEDLRRKGIVLRVRHEDGRWVQTLKASGRSAVERLEHNATIDHSGKSAPLPDPHVHDNTPAGDLLAAALEGSNGAPQWRPLFTTDVERVACLLQRGASRVEIAFDRGAITAGDDELLLREVEFELKEGSPRDAAALASEWMAAHGLWISTISKFEKGMRLAHGTSFGPPATARGLQLPGDATLHDLAQGAIASSLDQVLRNASDVAAGSKSNEHVHQLRVGIRRVRTALRELMPDKRDAVEDALVDTFRALGERRDVDHVLQQVDPLVRHAGGPAIATQEPDSLPQLARIVRDKAFQSALLELIAVVHEEPAGDEHRSTSARHALAKRLSRLARRATRLGLAFEHIDAAHQHSVRKRMKRLRYLAEFAAPLFAPKKVDRYVDELKPLQDALGAYNDEQVALKWYRDRASHDPHAWFAVGWLTARRDAQATRCAKTIRKFAKAAKPFWE